MKGFVGRATVEDLCRWAKVSKSSFHYKSHPGPRGMKSSTHTPQGESMIENDQVVEDIRQVLSQDYCVYGYQIMTHELRGLGYLINKKKVYRLMYENRLLCGKVIRCKGKREWVKFRRIEASRPMEYLCLDIKYVWVEGDKRWYYQLAIMDVYSRMIIAWIFQSSIKQTDVVALMRWLNLRYGLKGVIIRNDNGSQFIAHKVRQALEELEARQEFTHVATPEENAYIEAFHSIQQRELMDRFAFVSFYDAKEHIKKYIHWYNYIRRHGKLKGLTPALKWAQGFSCLTHRQQYEPDSLVMSRPNCSQALSAEFAPYSLDLTNETSYLRLCGEHENNQSVVNPFEKNVQRIGG